MALRLVYYAASRGIATLSNLDMQQCPKTFCNNVQKYFAILSKKCLQKTHERNEEELRYLHDFVHYQKLDEEFQYFREHAHEDENSELPFPYLVL